MEDGDRIPYEVTERETEGASLWLAALVGVVSGNLERFWSPSSVD